MDGSIQLTNAAFRVTTLVTFKSRGAYGGPRKKNKICIVLILLFSRIT